MMIGERGLEAGSRYQNTSDDLQPGEIIAGSGTERR